MMPAFFGAGCARPAAPRRAAPAARRRRRWRRSRRLLLVGEQVLQRVGGVVPLAEQAVQDLDVLAEVGELLLLRDRRVVDVDVEGDLLLHLDDERPSRRTRCAGRADRPPPARSPTSIADSASCAVCTAVARHVEEAPRRCACSTRVEAQLGRRCRGTSPTRRRAARSAGRSRWRCGSCGSRASRMRVAPFSRRMRASSTSCLMSGSVCEISTLHDSSTRRWPLYSRFSL